MKNKLNIIENKVINYTDNMYKSGPMKTSDFIIGKYDDVHNQLYENALNKYINSLGVDVSEFMETHHCTEIKSSEYYKPSKVIIVNMSYPFNRETVDLTEYWNNYSGDTGNKDISDLYIDSESIPNAELIYMDFNAGKAKFKNRVTGLEFWTTFDYVNSDTKLSPELSLSNTFTYLVNNK